MDQALTAILFVDGIADLGCAHSGPTLFGGFAPLPCARERHMAPIIVCVTRRRKRHLNAVCIFGWADVM